MTVVITPVGTSLFTNGSETKNSIKTGFNRIEKHPESQWEARGTYITTLETACEGFIREKIKGQEPESASAELQSSAKIQGTLGDITVHLLASDTITSRLAAEILKGNLAGNILGPQVSVTFNPDQDVIRGLQVKDRKAFLRKGMNALIRRIEQINSTLAGSNQSLAINITGGYGATLPYLTIYAQLKSVSLYYNFEDSNELIKIPPSPLSIDWDEIGPYFDVLQKIDDAEAIGKWKEFKSKYHKEVEKLGTFIWVDERDNSAYVSPLGEVFWDECLKYKHQVSFPDPVIIAPDHETKIMNGISNGTSGKSHHRPRGWEGIVKKLCENAYVEYVRYDSLAHGGQNVKVLDNGKNGHIGVRYTKGDETLPLRCETTARGKPQTKLVMEFIKRQLNL